jgi:loricrin
VNNGIFGFPRSGTSVPGINCWMIDTRDAIRVDEFEGSGTTQRTFNRISPPGGANVLTILAYGGGGGGQGGGAQLAGTVVQGGGAGGGGGTALVSYNLNLIPHAVRQKPYVLQVLCGGGGSTGAGRNTAGGGVSGGDGGNTSVNLTNSADTVLMRLAFANGGSGGSGTSGQRNGHGGSGMNMGMLSYRGTGTLNYPRGQPGGGTPGWNSGGFRFPAQFDANHPSYIPLHPYICGGGGSGGVVNTDGTSRQAGGAGGTGFFYYEPYRAADGGTGDGADATVSDIVFGGVGGNGGYSAVVADARAAWRGGNGFRGGGGGGGGGIVLNAATGTYSSGVGGQGGPGYAMLIWTP